MKSTHQSRQVAADLKKIYKEFSNAYVGACGESRGEKLKALAPGQAAPPAGKLYDGTAAAAAFKSEAANCRNRALEVLRTEKKRVISLYGSGPSNEAVNAVQMLSLNPAPTVQDVEMVKSLYGENTHVTKALRGISRKYELDVNLPCPALDYLEGMEGLEKSFNGDTFNPCAMSQRGANWDFMIESGIDKVFL